MLEFGVTLKISLLVWFSSKIVFDAFPDPRVVMKSYSSKGANFEHEKTLQIGKTLFDQQVKLENTSFLLNATVNIFDYFGGVLPYFCLAPLVFGGIYDDLDPSELSALISEVGSKFLREPKFLLEK